MQTFKTFFNSYQRLVEGGAAGHMTHVFEDYGLTFGELKEMLQEVFSGEIEFTEKCLAPDTLVLLEKNGLTKISDVVDNRIEDNVLSYDSISEKVSFKSILAYVKNDNTDDWLRITLSNRRSIVCTPNHRIYCPDTKTMIKAGAIKIGTPLLICSGIEAEVISITPLTISQPRYDIKVDEYSCYFANGILVHNTDGQNLSVTWKDGECRLARNKATLKDPLTVEQTAKKFEGRGPIKDAFVNSLKDISKALSSVDANTLNKWFKNGKAFLSIEIIYPPTKNVIDYGNRCLLQLHGMQEYDEKFNKVGEDKELAKEIFDTLNANDALKQDTFTITGPQVLSIKNLTSSKDEVKKLIDQISRVEFKYDLEDKSTLQDYINVRWEEYLKNKFEDIPEPALNSLLNRFAKGDKAIKKPQLIKDVQKYGISKQDVEELVSVENSLNSKFISVISDLIVKAGSILLNNLDGYISLNPSESVNKLTKEVEKARELLKAGDEKSIAQAQKFIQNLDRVGLDNIAPAEGIVFKYKDKVYKLTGKFGAINQLLGVFKFGGR